MKQVTLWFAVLLLAFTATAQNIEKDLDGLFTDWKKPNQPGGTVWVAQKNKTVFSKAYGLANIPYNVPNDLQTIYNIGSLSKQFTALGIVLLQLEGKLSLDDDIRKYLPEMHSFQKTITVRHLLHHTSGLRSSPEFFALAGWRDGDAITNEDAYRFLTQQTQLNFEPGSEYMYSNSGYILLAKIIENIAQQDFKSWTKEKIFQPLGMNTTFVEEDGANILSKTATSYAEAGPSDFKNIENYDLTYGASNVYTNGADLLKWAGYLKQAPQGWQKALDALKTLDPLSNDSKKNNYAFGLFLDDFYGNTRIQHTGAVGGFRAVMYCYPDDDLQIVILSNFTSNQSFKVADQISQYFLQDKSKPQQPQEPTAAIELKNEVLKQYEGAYWNDQTNVARKIYLENNTLWYVRSNQKKSPLIPMAQNQFLMGGINEKLVVSFDVSAGKMNLLSANGTIDKFDKYNDQPLTTQDLQEYTGTYYSPELESTYTLSLKDGKLYVYHSKFGSGEVQVLKKDVLDWSGSAISKYRRDKNQKINGFDVSLNRVRNLWFEKLK